jgi:hypothetical protein
VMQVPSYLQASFENDGSLTLTTAVHFVESVCFGRRTSFGDMIKSTSESKFKTDMAEESLGRLPMRMAEKSDGRETRPVVAPFPNSAQAPPNSRVESSIISSF